MNDPSVAVKRDVSAALGPGWRLGFLGMLHMEVFSQRLEQEHDVQTILTSPSVSFRATLKNGKTIDMESSASFPEPHEIKKLEEPMVLGTLVFPAEYVGSMIHLCEERRGRQLVRLGDVFGKGGERQARQAWARRAATPGLAETLQRRPPSLSLGHALPRRLARHSQVQVAPQRGRGRLLRPRQVAVLGLRHL